MNVVRGRRDVWRKACDSRDLAIAVFMVAERCERKLECGFSSYALKVKIQD